ncbi:MAG: AAA family ATPase [Candidatus Saliniplasma sp.]
MVLILLTGMPGSGKEEFLRVAKEFDYDVVRMGDVVREIAKQENILMDDISIGSFAHDQRENYHFGIWAERTLNRIGDSETVIDGVRSYEEVEIFKSELQEKMVIVAVHASPETRYGRLKKRDREDKPEDWGQFVERDHRELDWGVGKIIALADKMLVNEGTVSQFHNKAERFFTELNGK